MLINADPQPSHNTVEDTGPKKGTKQPPMVDAEQSFSELPIRQHQIVQTIRMCVCACVVADYQAPLLKHV